MLRRGLALLSAPRRNYLSAAYNANEAWLATAKVIPLPSAVELHSKLEGNPPTKLDVEICALAAITSRAHAGELRDLLHRLRVSASSELPTSASFAAIQAFMASDSTAELLDVLDDRLNYGLFLDDITANMLLDKFIVAEDFVSAAKVASFLMLQENFESPITEKLAIYALYKYLKNLEIKIEENVVAEPTSTPKKKKIEEIKIRVAYLRNPYFDDHFDLRDDALIGGKSLMMVSNSSDALNLNCRLIGWIFYKKYDKARVLLQTLLDNKELFTETRDLIKKNMDSYKPDSVERKSLETIYSEIENCPTQDFNVEGEMIKNIVQAVSQHESEHVTKHLQLIKDWEVIRKKNLDEQLDILEQKRLAEQHAAREIALKKINERIWYFDNEDKVELVLEEKYTQLAEQKEYYKTAKKTKESDDNYIPPPTYRPRKATN